MPVTRIESCDRPETLDEAWALLTAGVPAVRLVGGGTDLTIHCPPEVRGLVDLGGLGLRFIEVEDAGSLRIGAMATLTDLMEHRNVADYAAGVIPEMLVHVGSPLLRNAATVGGHLARGRISDVVPVLLALDADISLFDGSPHRTSLADYYETGRNREPHVLTELHLPAPDERTAAAFLRFSRTAFDRAILNAACRIALDGEGLVLSARIAVGETPDLARRVPAAEEALTGETLVDSRLMAAADAAREHVATRSDRNASADYRSHLVGVAVSRCLSSVRERLGGET